MNETYRDERYAASTAKLLESDESDCQEPEDLNGDTCGIESPREYESQKGRGAYSIIRLARDVLLYMLAFVGLAMIGQRIAESIQESHDHRTLAHSRHSHHMDHAHDQLETSHIKVHGKDSGQGKEENWEHKQDSHPLEHCNCGTSVEEATALGCKYDSLAAAWLPEHCRDEELTAEFETLGSGPNGSWTYWADSNHTKELSLTKVAAMADEPSVLFYMSYDWHVVHCLFYWRKQIRSRSNGKTVEARYDSEVHALHCSKIIRSGGWGTMASVVLHSS